MEFIWYDYEAWGKNPRVDRPAQVAAIRTDENLEQIGREVQWYCIPREDCVISPKAVSITGITPQYAFDVRDFRSRICQENTRDVNLASRHLRCRIQRYAI